MKRYPLYIDLNDKPVAIVGGGEAALAKSRLVLAAGATVRLIWPRIDDGARAELAGKASFIERAPEMADFTDAALVFVAVDDDGEADKWAEAARNAGTLVNVVDRPELCDFTTPSIIDRGALTIAISTAGAAPVLGRKLRADIEALLAPRVGALIEFAAQYRDAVKAGLDAKDRRAFWEDFFGGPIAAAFLAGDETRARDLMLARLNRPQAQEQVGVVHIVGAGPGDPDLLTVKALRLLQKADVIVHDRLVSDEILGLARRDAQRLYVGKAKARHAVPQNEIEQTLIDLARRGKMVVRLKGGDPFVFGRGGEELDALARAGVEAYVTPGITAATGCAASAGFALTHRDYAQAVTFVTGHAKGDQDPDLDWAALARLGGTLVIYMGLSKAERIAAQLIENGAAASTPAAIIENGTRPDQRVVKARLDGLGEAAAQANMNGPALIVVGEAAARADAGAIAAFIEQERRVA